MLTAQNLVDLENKKPSEVFEAVVSEFKNSMESLIEMINESKNILNNPTQNNLRLIKLDALVEYIYDETKRVLFPVNKKKLSKDTDQQVIFLTRSSKISSEIGKLIKKMSEVIMLVREKEADFSVEAKQDIEKCLAVITSNLIMVKNITLILMKKFERNAKNDQELRANINQGYKNYFSTFSR